MAMDMNPAWAHMIGAARERLRLECLRNRILTPDEPLDDVKSASLDAPAPEASWKNSWRRTTGKKSRGRVRGMTHLFENADGVVSIREASETSTASETRSRSTSNASESSVASEGDSGTESEVSYDGEVTRAIKWSAIQPLPLYTPGATRLAIEDPDKTVGSAQVDDVAEDVDISLLTIKSASRPATISKATQPNLADIFTCAEVAADGFEETAKIKSRNGSMVLVKASQLAECVLCRLTALL